jgi:uncharacterized protein YcbK (DUF882 family)
MQRLALLVITALCIGGTPAMAGAGKATASSTSSAPASAKKSKKKSKKSKKRVAAFKGHNASKSSLRTEPLPKPSGDVWLRAENLGEEVRVNIYKADGSFDDAALAKLDDLFRCSRTGAVRAVRAELFEVLSRFHDQFEGKRIDLVSGFRNQERDSSRHFHAAAADIRIKGISIKELYRFAESLDAGGMGIGIYPVSGFIHVDYRAPGEPSYRWTDTTGPDSGKKSKGKKKKKKPSHRTQPARKPTS